MGKVWKTSQPYASGGSPSVWTVYEYDSLGRTTRVTLPDGSQVLYEFLGNWTKVTDPAGKSKEYYSDAFGNLIRVVEPAAQGSGTVETTYAYDLLSHLTQVNMTRGSTTQVRTFSYDATTQRLISMTHPESGTTSFTYNNDGTLLRRTDAKTQKVQYSYDAYQRPAMIQRFLSSGSEDQLQRVTFTYDTATNGWGRVGQINWQTGGGMQFAYNYAYTAAGLATSKKLTVTKTRGSYTQSGNLEVTYSYDTEGKLTSLVYPTERLEDPAYPGQYRYLSPPATGLTYNYTYDSLGRPIAMSSPAHSRTGNQPVTWVDNVSYGVANEMLAMRYRLDAANGQTTPNYYNESRQYNTRLQLTQLGVIPTGGASTPLNITYQFSSGLNDGLIEKSIDNLAGETNYLYDNWKRLVSATQPATNGWGLSLTYDGFGNRTDQTVTKGSAIESHLTFTEANNRIASAGYAYDANGNLAQMPTGSGSATLEYDIENRLTRFYVASAGIEERYGYGPSNERVWKSGANQDTQDEVFFYGVDGKLLGRYHPALSGACNLMLVPLGKNVYFAGKLIRSQDRAVVTDRLGTVRISYNESENEKISNYYPFGEEISPLTPQNRDKFATYFRDGTTGLDYAMNRYYSSGPLGRFLTSDPYLGSANPSNPQSWNRYAYVNNDPIDYNDPEGLTKCGELFMSEYGRDIQSVFSSTDEGLFAGVIWAEAGFNRQDQIEVALSIANRWSIVNNYTYVFVPDENYEAGRRYLIPRGWGTPGSINNILTAEHQYETVAGGHLTVAFQSNLNSALNADAYIYGTDELTNSCKKVTGAAYMALGVLSGLINNSYSAFRETAMVTSFAGNPTPSSDLGEILLGSVGTNNVFAGIPWGHLARGNGSPPVNKRRPSAARTAAQTAWRQLYANIILRRRP